MVNLEYVIKSDCKPTAISLFFRGQHGSIIPDPCPWAFSYNWHQILFWRRYLFSLAFRPQLASVWDLICQSHRFPSLNVISDRPRSPSQLPLWEFGAGFAGLSPLACLQGAGQEHAWIWGPSLVTCWQCSHKVQSGISWSGFSVHRVPHGWKSSGRGESCMGSPAPPTLFPFPSFLLPLSPSHCQVCLSIRQI